MIPFAPNVALEDAWLFLKGVVLPESEEHWSPDLIMWHLKQRGLGTPEGIQPLCIWDSMPRPKARTTHGFHGEPVPEDILANPPIAFADVTENTDEEWQKKIQMREADDENQAARREWYGLSSPRPSSRWRREWEQ